MSFVFGGAGGVVHFGELFSTATLKVCTNCGREPEEGIHSRCQKCLLVGYCSEKCEKAGREEHKLQCDLICSARASTFESDAVMRQINACHEPPANVHLMKAALVEMTKPTLEGVDNPEVAKKGKMWKREYEGEATYMHFYEEMVENEREWLEFFRHEQNSYHCMASCRVLNTLATIHCKRGENETCGQMLVLFYKTFALYKRTCSQRGDPEEWCANMEYRVKLTHFHLNCNLKKYKANVTITQQLACHEAKYHEGNSLNHLGFFMERTGKLRLTEEEIMAVPREEVLFHMKARAESPSFKQFVEKEEKRTKLLVCGHCGKREEGMKQFKVCPRCMDTPYCSRDCQAKAWKSGHKKVCGKSKKK